MQGIGIGEPLIVISKTRTANNTNAIQHLIAAYKQDPCRYHACALWKTLKNIDKMNLVVDQDTIMIYNDDRVLLDYHKNSQEMSPSIDLETINMIILHGSQMNETIARHFQHAERYFRLRYDPHQSLDNTEHDFILQTVNTEREMEQVSQFVCQCYIDIKPNAAFFEAYSKEAVFDPTLWLWVIDPVTHERVGLGIAELDRSIGEGSLDWIQVLPEHSGKGLGTIIVNELIERLQPRSEFITVSGKSPIAEKLYRRCGFVGNDLWYVLRK